MHFDNSPILELLPELVEIDGALEIGFVQKLENQIVFFLLFYFFLFAVVEELKHRIILILFIIFIVKVVLKWTLRLFLFSSKH